MSEAEESTKKSLLTLESRNVFIDTQYFVKAGLHFDNAALKSFRRLCETDELFHITTTVVNKEVERKIQSSVKDGLAALQSFRRKARLLKSLEDDQIQGLFIKPHEEDIFNKASEVFDEFLSGCKSKTVDASGINAEDVLSLYFETKPPFSEAKKSEFPDAISLLSLKSYLDDEEKLYVISDDGDMKSFCSKESQLILVETLDKFLDIYSSHTSILTDNVKQYFETNIGAIESKIEEVLGECEAYNSSTWEDAEVDDGLTVVNIGEIDPFVIYVSEEEAQVTFDVDVDFEVTVTGPDFNNGIYDKEDGRIYTFDSSSNTCIISRTFTVEIWLGYDFVNGNLENIHETSFHIAGISGGIEVCVEENEGWHK